MMLQEFLGAAVEATPERDAITTPHGAWTYARLGTASDAMAAALVELGVQPGDRVAVLLPKQPEGIAALYGILKAGAIVVPLDPLAPVPYVAAVILDCQASVLVTTSPRAAMVQDVEGGTPLRGVLVVGEPPSVPLRIPATPYTEALGAPSPVPGADSDVAYLFYTSGSTGTPKGVMHTHGSLVAGARWFARTMGVRSDDRLYAPAPLHFILSMYAIFPAALTRATSVLSLMERPMRGDLARLVPAREVTVWVSTPFPLRMLLAAASPGSLRSLRTVMCGGGTLRGREVRTLQELAPQARVWQAYGSTEAAAVSRHLVEEVADDDRPVGIGVPIEDSTVLVVGESGDVVDEAEEGELYVRSPRMMSGYWGDAQRTGEVMVPDPRGSGTGARFYRSGDVVRRREEGALEYVRRTDQMVKSRGYRVNLNEVESVMNGHPAIRDSVAVALPHPEWGVSIVACLELNDGVSTNEANLRGHVAARLPAYMVPQRIEIRDELPRTSTGKVDRQHLVTELSESSG